MPKFMQSLGPESYQRLAIEAKARDVTVQSLIRTVIVPEWLKTLPQAQPTSPINPARSILQPATLLTRTGIVAQQNGRSFLNTIGRGKP